MKGFSVSFETYTRESVENGDAEERGMLVENVTLREAVAELRDLDALDVIEGDGEWFRATQGSDRYLYLEGDEDEGESRTLHVPRNVTPASRKRIGRALRAYGYR